MYGNTKPIDNNIPMARAKGQKCENSILSMFGKTETELVIKFMSNV